MICNGTKSTPPLPTPMYHRIFNSSYPPHVLFLFTSFWKMNVTRFGYMAKGKSQYFVLTNGQNSLPKKKGKRSRPEKDQV